MRNLKRVLSLSLAAIMLLGMMVIGSSAATDYPDVDYSADNVEAIEVLEAINVMTGFPEDGTFKPDSEVTRGQMARIMAALMDLDYDYYIGANPFSDMKGHWAEAYAAACYANGIIAGRTTTTYDPEATVTAVEAAAMLMRALGYFQNKDVDYPDGFVISTIRQAGKINLFSRVDAKTDEPMTRNDVAQLILNTLQSGMVEPDTNSRVEVTVGSTNYVYVVARDNIVGQAINDTKAVNGNSSTGLQGWILDLGEKLYNGELKLKHSQDDFCRPARTWEYKSKEIGTYARTELIKAEYSAKVTGKTLYELLTRSVIQDYDLEVYVDGAWVEFNRDQLVRSNEEGIVTTSALYGAKTSVGITGNGVETQVFLDPDEGVNGKITIVVVNTWLARATADYNKTTETATVEVYHLYQDNGIIKRVDVEDVPFVADLEEDDLFLVQWASDGLDFQSKDVLVACDVPKYLTDVTVTKFSKSPEDSSAGYGSAVTDRVTSITTEGTEYKNSAKAYYEHTTLYEYNNELLTKKTYDVYFDNYGYFIGASLHSGEDQYVFISAANTNATSLGVRNADALAIFVDGTLETISVNVTDTNKNIRDIRAKDTAGGKTVAGDPAYNEWDSTTTGINHWFTYTENNGVYTLTPVTRYSYDVASADDGKIEVQSDRVSLVKSRIEADKLGKATGNAYGNDDSVYITTDLIYAVDKGNYAVDEITGRYTGVQSVRLTYAPNQPTNTKDKTTDGWISAVYNSKDNIIAAVLSGEAEGSTDNYAYILTGATSEEKNGDYYYWTFDAVLAGEKQELTARSRFSRTIQDLTKDSVQELIFDTDGYVTTIKNVADNLKDCDLKTSPDKVYGIREYIRNLDNTIKPHLLSDYDMR